MRFTVFGTVGAAVDGKPVKLYRAQRRAAFAYLLLHANRCVTAEQLIDALWGDEPPSTAKAQVHAAVSAIRVALRAAGHDPFAPVAGGYLLAAGPDRLDLEAFRGHTEAARRATQADRPDAAIGHLRDALDLWRDNPLAGIAAAFAEPARTRLRELHLAAAEQLAELELAAECHLEALPRLTALAEANPLRERTIGHCMLALFRSGRRGEALSLFRATRRRLVDELGIEPGPQLRRLHERMLADDPALSIRRPPAATATTGSWRFLPRDVVDFVGRGEELAALDSFAAPGPGSTGAVVISAVVGAGGVGKTALAIRWAHRAGAAYPDGQLYVDLRGYDQETPYTALEALTHLLTCLGVPPARLPTDLDAACARYRSILAGKRVLVVLDNARTADQVRPLLPGGTGCFTLITSRDRLSGLVAREGAKRVSLGLMPKAEARQLLVRILGNERIGADRTAVDELINLCAGLPLTIRIAAAHLSDHPSQTLSEYVRYLIRVPRLTAWTIEGDEQYGIEAVISRSYEILSERDRRVFRLLGAIPGPDFTVDAIASLTDICADDARAALETLVSAHLLEEIGDRRYALHDLVREYAARLLKHSGDPTREPLERYLAHLKQQSIRALEIARRGGPQTKPDAPVVAGAEAMDWLRAERRNLAAALATAITDGRNDLAVAIAEPLREIHRFGGMTGDWINVSTHALAAMSDRGADPAAHSYFLNSLGGAYIEAGRLDEAIGLLQQCITVREGCGDRIGAARSRANLAMALEWQGGYDHALAEANTALLTARELGDTVFELQLQVGTVTTILGRAGRLTEARDILLQALDRVDPAVAATTTSALLTNLGKVYTRLDQPDLALPHLEQALAHDRALKIPRAEAAALASIAEAHLALARPKDAVRTLEQAVLLIREHGTRGELCEQLIQLGRALDAADRTAEAETAYTAALGLARDLGNQDLEEQAALGLAASH